MNGATDSAFRFPDVAQQGFAAQQGEAHAFWFGTFANAHVDDTEVSAIVIATTSVSETAILLSIICFLAYLRPSVESDVRFWAGNTRNARSSTRKAHGVAGAGLGVGNWQSGHVGESGAFSGLIGAGTDAA